MFNFLSCDSNKPEVFFGNGPAQVSLRGSDGSDVVDNTLQTLLETRCNSVFANFNPAWWLSNGHLQTMYCVTGDFSKKDKLSYHRTYLRLDDGGTLGLDFAPVDQSPLRKDAPIVVVQHGLTGGSYEPYVRAILSRACAPLEEGGLGYRGVVINFRGCAGVPVTSPLFYSGAHTNDTRQALRYIAYLYPDALILGVGFSLGANVLIRYLGEERELSRVHAACALGCPWDLLRNKDGLEGSFLGSNIYSKAMARNLLRLLKRHAHSFDKIPDHHVAKACENALKLENPTLAMFDHTFTSVAGGPPPNFPFRSGDEYYIYASSHKIVNQVTVPLLTINAKDDPVVRHVPTENRENGNVVMVLTRSGGHLGWFQGGSEGEIDRWTTKPVLEWLKVMGGDVIHEPRQRSSIYVDEEGFLRERGQEQLGCKQIQGGGLIDGNGEEGILQGL